MQKPTLLLCTMLWVLGYSSQMNSQIRECGRLDWSKVVYNYYAGHRSRNPRDAAIVGILSDGEKTTMLAYKAGENREYYYAPVNFGTNDTGKMWKAVDDDVPSRVPATPYGYFQAPSDSHVIYRLIPEIQLYIRSDDAGQSWIMPHGHIEGEPPEQVAEKVAGSPGFHVEIHIVGIHPTQPLTIYAGIRVVAWGDDLKEHELKGVYKSLDGGENWQMFSDRLLPFSRGWTGTSPLGVHPKDPAILFGQGIGGILKSVDGGKTWLPVGQISLLEARPLYRREQESKTMSLGAPSTQEVYEFLFDPHTISTLYMLTNRGIFKTIDEGATWRLLDVGFDEIDAINSVAINPSSSNQIFVGSRYGIFASDDAGCHFRRIPSPGEQTKRLQ